MAIEHSLFSRLKRLFPSTGFPLEDYLTELVAHAASKHPETFISWLRELGATNMDADSFLQVQTQYYCIADPLAGTPEKYPDVVVHISDQTRSEIIFLESKVGSDLSGDDQLQLYARILSERVADKHTLIFITRDYSPQQSEEVLSLVNSGKPLPDFIQTRWHNFAAYWSHTDRPTAKDPLSAELIHFMKEQQLSQETQLSPQALAALGGFHQAFDVLRAAIDDDLRSRVKDVSGSVRDDYDTSVAVARERMFVLRSGKQNQNLWVNIGFWLPADDTGYSIAFGDIGFRQKSAGKKEILAAFHEFTKVRTQDWKCENVSDVAPWGRILRERSLAEFLGEKNHVAALRKYFHCILDDIAEFRRTYPDLRWQ